MPVQYNPTLAVRVANDFENVNEGGRQKPRTVSQKLTQKNQKIVREAKIRTSYLTAVSNYASDLVVK